MRIPLGVDIESRDGTLTKDAKVVNGIVESAGDESYVYKRPGNEDLGLIRAGTAQLLVFWNGLKAIISDYLCTTGSATEAVTRIATPTWTSRTMPSSVTWNAVAYGGGIYCAVAQTGAVATSSDGITWTASATITARNWYSMAWNGTVFCVIAYNSTSTATSPDGVTWTQTGTLPATGHYTVSSNGTGLFVVPRAAPSQNVATSTDGLTWTNQASVLPASKIWQFCAWDGTVFCASTGASETNAATSPDGVTWTARTRAVSTQTSGVIAGGGIIIIACTSGTTINVSTDHGVTFTSRTLPFSQGSLEYGGYNGSSYLLISGASSNSGATSIDGTTWTATTLSSSGFHSGVASNGSGFVAIRTGSSTVDQSTVAIAPSVTATNLSPTTAGSIFSAQDNGSNAGTAYLMLKNLTQAWSLTNASGATPTLITDVDYPGTYAVTLTSLTRSGTVATATTPTDTNFQVGSTVTIAGATPSNYNGAQVITAVTGSSTTKIGPIPITITRSGATATATSLINHGLSTGQTVTMAGAVQPEYNGSFVITWISATTFSFTVTVTNTYPASPATGSPILANNFFFGNTYNQTGTLTTIHIDLVGSNTDVLVNGETITVVNGVPAFMGDHVIGSVNSFGNQSTYTDGGISTLQFATNVMLKKSAAPVISSITSANGVATVTTSAAHNYRTGKIVGISGCTQTAYNGNFSITVTSSTTFTFLLTNAESPSTPATGTITATQTTTIGATFTFSISGSPASPATGTITATGGRATVPGIGYVNGYFTVVDIYGVLYNSAPDDPTTWNALEYTTADSVTGAAKAHAQTGNYLLVFKEWSVEPFYDRQDGQVGSPFGKLENGLIQIGCASGTSLAKMDDSIYWMSQAKEEGRAVHVMTGTSVQKVSTAAIDRVLKLDSLSEVHALAMKINGHSFYILTLVNTNVTLVYDATSQKWGQWTSVDDYFKYTYFANALGRYMTLHTSYGHLYEFDTSNYQDAGVTISTLFRTVRLDGGGLNPKVLGRAIVIGDSVADTLSERHSDDDCATFSSWRTANLAYELPMYRSLGSFRRRTMEFKHTGNNPIRLKAIELEVT